MQRLIHHQLVKLARIIKRGVNANEARIETNDGRSQFLKTVLFDVNFAIIF